MLWNIAIVDDSEPDREALIGDLRARIAGQDALSVMDYASAQALLDAWRPGAFQLVFLDICMEGMNGVELARQLRTRDASVLIVFLTSSVEFMPETFPVHPFDYLVKPCRFEDLSRVLKEARRVLTLPEPELLVRADRQELRIPYGNISAAQSQGHAVVIELAAGEHIRSAMTFSEIEHELSADPRFLQCNRGILLNMDHIASTDGSVFIMKNGARFPIRIREQRALVASFSQYQISHTRGRMR